jgi:hypothetical protein
MAQSISSAEPEKLFRYSDFGLQLDHELISEAGRLSGSLRHFEHTCTEPGFRMSVAYHSDALGSHSSQCESLDSWVGTVGRGFLAADSGGVGSVTRPILSWLPLAWNLSLVGIPWPLSLVWLITVPSWLKNVVGDLPWTQKVVPVPVPPPRPIFEELPVPLNQVTWIQWYGNTEFAYGNRELYRELQGLHSGLDFCVPTGTPIVSTVNQTGEVISLDGKPYDYKAGPGSILIDYGDFIVLYGHTSGSDVKLGDDIEPGQIVGYTGSDGTTEHLHMEVILKDATWEQLPLDKKASTRPGSVRTNPVPFLSPELRKVLDDKPSGEFHPTDDGRWLTPDDQPDITPGGSYAV